MTRQVLIVGAGTGGLMIANHLARTLEGAVRGGEVGITVLGDRDHYVYQPGFLYVAFDLMRPADLVRPVRSLLHPGIRFVHDRARHIDPAAQTVQTAGGAALHYDYLVLATGSEIHPEQIPGLAEGGHWFYTLEGAIQLRETLKQFRGGKLVMAVGLPHKCPVAPLEFAFMFDDWSRRRGIRDKTEIYYTFPINGAHSIEACSRWATAEFAERNIALEVFFNMEEVDPAARVIRSLEGSEVPYDLLVAVPPHIGAPVHGQSGLGEAGNWLPTHRNRLTLGDHDNIFVIGDAANLPISKAGSAAHYQSEVVADNLIAMLEGGLPSHTYEGRTFCFIQSGWDKATYLSFDYTHPPMLSAPTQATYWFKQMYNRIHWLNLQAIV